MGRPTKLDDWLLNVPVVLSSVQVTTDPESPMEHRRGSDQKKIIERTYSFPPTNLDGNVSVQLLVADVACWLPFIHVSSLWLTILQRLIGICPT